MVIPRDYAEIAYKAYYDFSQGKSLISGLPLPKFNEQREDVQKAWEAAAKAVLDFDNSLRQ
jgi:hypothetical protein